MENKYKNLSNGIDLQIPTEDEYVYICIYTECKSMNFHRGLILLHIITNPRKGLKLLFAYTRHKLRVPREW